MQGEVPTEDLITGSIILVVFLVCVCFAGRVLSRFKNARYTSAWQPLIPVIAGKVVDDGGGAATSWVVGTYKGRAVAASMTPDRNRFTGESGFRYNYFDVALTDVAGRADWSLKGRPVAADAGLQQRLADAQAMSVLEAIGRSEAVYDSRERSLKIIQETGPGWTPSRAQFEQQLETLLRLSEINAAVN
jgi:hypothetical protein